MTAAPLDLDALETQLREIAECKDQVLGRILLDDYSEDLRDAAPALFAAAREHDKLREALEEAEKFIEDELQTRKSGAPFSSTVADPYDQDEEYNAYVLEASDALAKARAALGKPSVTSTSDPSPK